jgi:hypothetical protein
MNAENCSPSTLAKTMKMSAKPPLVIHIFSPLSRQEPSGWRVARVRAPSASDPEPDSLRQYAPTISPETMRGRYFSFCASVPKQRIGTIDSPVCAPNAVANDAQMPIASPTTTAETLSSSTPPNRSGTSTPSSPSSPARTSNFRATDQSFCSSAASAGLTSCSMNSDAVRSIRHCSSVSRSGVKICPDSSVVSHSPPLWIVAVVMSVMPGLKTRPTY